MAQAGLKLVLLSQLGLTGMHYHSWLYFLSLKTFLLGTGGSACNQEAEIRKILVQSQPGQIVREILSQKNPS
jgi:hypothetical protein